MPISVRVCKRWITPRIPYLPKPCHNYCMEWQVFCFSVLHLGPFYFKSFGACAISTLNNIRSKRHLWQKENIVQMRSGFLWFRSAAWVDLWISNGARRIKSVRVTFITRHIQCLFPAKKYKLYKSSINKSIHFVQRSLSSSTRVQVQRVTAQLNLSREWKNRMTTVVISAILNPVSRVSTPH